MSLLDILKKAWGSPEEIKQSQERIIQKKTKKYSKGPVRDILQRALGIYEGVQQPQDVRIVGKGLKDELQKFADIDEIEPREILKDAVFFYTWARHMEDRGFKIGAHKDVKKPGFLRDKYIFYPRRIREEGEE